MELRDGAIPIKVWPIFGPFFPMINFDTKSKKGNLFVITPDFHSVLLREGKWKENTYREIISLT